jgi:non-canonical purine NTP pyrophosphatase (RdgB/HAM1 family)
MANVTFITGNQNKADHLAKYLGHPIEHVKLDLDEIQSLDLGEIVEHKVKQAYAQIKKPVLVEDVSLEFAALGRLPGPLIKWFVDELKPEQICALLGEETDRTAIGRCMFGYYDGERLEFFEGSVPGKIARKPAGNNGFGWNNICIPDGYDKTWAELDEEEFRKLYTQIRPFAKIKAFLESLN